MTIQEYIDSGAIEAYVLGVCSAKEKAEFEELCKQSPELREARLRFEMALEEKAFANAIPPPPELKEKVLELIGQENAIDTAKEIIALPPVRSNHRKISSMSWAIAASVTLLVGIGGFIFFLYQKNNELENSIAKSHEQLEQLNAKSNQAEQYPETKQVNVTIPTQKIPASIKVFWDSTNAHVYLVIRDLEKLPAGEKYQVWSISKGKHTSLGLFDAPGDDKLILKVNNAQQSDAFAISIVKGQ